MKPTKRVENGWVEDHGRKDMILLIFPSVQTHLSRFNLEALLFGRTEPNQHGSRCMPNHNGSRRKLKHCPFPHVTVTLFRNVVLVESASRPDNTISGAISGVQNGRIWIPVFMSKDGCSLYGYSMSRHLNQNSPQALC